MILLCSCFSVVALRYVNLWCKFTLFANIVSTLNIDAFYVVVDSWWWPHMKVDVGRPKLVYLGLLVIATVKIKKLEQVLF